jgi:short-subunit dehydrogenase involved in D-alanine esterification of teichoic acids
MNKAIQWDLEYLSKKDIEELVNNGIVESMEYYDDIEFNIYPLMDYLRTDQIKQLYEWLYDTYKEMNKDVVNNVGIEYLLVVKKYLDNINTRVGTAYTQ